jgi:hypothetical protein
MEKASLWWVAALKATIARMEDVENFIVFVLILFIY